jgi:3-mercaptopyruvate sulfurtransferase SseA
VHAVHRHASIVVRALALCATGIAVGLIGSLARTGGLPRAHPGQAACEAPAIEPALLSPAAAARICATAGALIADARGDADFAAGHIAGAVHLPCAAGEVAGGALAHLADRPLVLVYGRDTADALLVARSIAQRLPAAGGPKVYALDGGFSAWESAGLACASGPCEGCGAGAMSPAPVSR